MEEVAFKRAQTVLLVSLVAAITLGSCSPGGDQDDPEVVVDVINEDDLPEIVNIDSIARSGGRHIGYARQSRTRTRTRMNHVKSPEPTATAILTATARMFSIATTSAAITS